MSNQVDSQSSTYIHGSSPEEQRRLSLLNDLLNLKCLKELNPDAGSRILDVGCGLGQFSRAVSHAVGTDGFVMGVERDEQQFKQAGDLASERGERELVEFRLGDALELPLSDAEWGTFDLAYCRFLLEHLSDPIIAVSQMAKAVRPGGRIFLVDDDHDYFHPWPEPENFQPLWQAYVRSYEHLGNDPYIGRQLVVLLQQAGLTSVQNSSIFFGGCAGNDSFQSVAGNLVSALAGAKETIFSSGLLDQATYERGMKGLKVWTERPDSALWYSICCAEGVVSATNARI